MLINLYLSMYCFIYHSISVSYFNHYITCPSLIYSFWLYCWQHFQTFWILWLILVFIYEKTAKLKMVKLMTNINIHENTNTNYVGFFQNCVTFDTMNISDLQYSHKYTCIYFRLYLQISARFLSLLLSKYFTYCVLMGISNYLLL